MKTNCPLCEGAKLYPLSFRSSTLIHQNRVYASEIEAKSASSGVLDMCLCLSCGFVFNRSFDPKLITYGDFYENCQTFSQKFQEHVGNRVKRIQDVMQKKKGILVEIGCGQGDFLKQVMVNFPKRRAIGYDPACQALNVGQNLIFHKEYFPGKERVEDVCAVISRHVIEHIPDPVKLMRSLFENTSPGTRMFFETPCVEWIVKNSVIWDFFYEHCSLFSAKSLSYLFEKTGFFVEKSEYIFEGQYLWFEVVRKNGEIICIPEGKFLGSSLLESDVSMFEQYEKKERVLWASLRERMLQRREKTKIAIWGAGAKGVTFVSQMDPDRSLIECVVDINPRKQGGWIGKSAHPVISPSKLRDYGVGVVFVMNSNYLDEIRETLKGQNISVIGLEDEICS